MTTRFHVSPKSFTELRRSLAAIESALNVLESGASVSQASAASSTLTTKGDLLTRDGTDTIRLGVGTNGQVLTADSDEADGLDWKDAAGGGSGDVVGPASATDNAIVRYDSTTGKLIQDSGVTISDTDVLTLGGDLDVNDKNIIPGASGVVTVQLGDAAGADDFVVQDSNAAIRFRVDSDGVLTVWGSLELKGGRLRNTLGDGNISIELGDTAGADKLRVKDSALDEVFAVDSDGNVTLIGTVDGRDVAADGDKLNTIATNANNYSHPDHTGDVTSTGDGATAIGTDKVVTAKILDSNVTLAKLADLAQDRIIGRVTASTGAPEAMTKAQVLSMINVADGAQVNTSHVWEHYLYLESPATDDAFPIAGPFDGAGTVTDIWGETDTGTVAFNIEERAASSAFSSGTDIITGEGAAATTQEHLESGAMDNTGIAANASLFVTISGTPSADKVLIGIRGTWN